MGDIGQVDRWAHRQLPPREDWPELILPAELAQERPLNCVEWLLDRHIANDLGDRVALISDRESWRYRDLYRRVNRLANLMTQTYGVESGNRVLIRAPNTPATVAAWLAIQKCGAIAVTTMSLLRERELRSILDISAPALAICASSMTGALYDALASCRDDVPVYELDLDGEVLDEALRHHPDAFETRPTLAEDIALIGFTSGTTGKPKGTMHFHRDVLSVCRTIADEVLAAKCADRFIGTSPLAFTFGLGGLALFPLYAGASSVLNPAYTPTQLVEAIGHHQASICFTVPSFYQRMSQVMNRRSVRSLRMAVSSGEALPVKTRQQWKTASGLELTELLGSTEMLHAFIGATGDAIRPGFIGRALPGYTARILDDHGKPVPAGELGRLAVKGLTGCRYLKDERQKDYVQNGWNITGDTCSMTGDGYVRYHARRDDMIISSGYNISGLEVEDVLLEAPNILECAVIGTPDAERGQVVTAYVVVRNGVADGQAFKAELQAFVKDRLAPYKYPRRIELLDALPRNESGKVQRFRLQDVG